MRLFKFAIQGLALVWFGTFAWWLASNLSADAVGILIGLLFGLMAGIPATLIILHSGQRRSPQFLQKTTNVILVQSPDNRPPRALHVAQAKRIEAR